MSSTTNFNSRTTIFKHLIGNTALSKIQYKKKLENKKIPKKFSYKFYIESDSNLIVFKVKFHLEIMNNSKQS